MDGDNPQLVGKLKSMRYERVLPAEKEELEKVIAYGLKPGVLTTVVAGIETNLVLLGEGLEEVAILTASRFKSNEDDVGMVSGLMQNVKAGIGTTPTDLDISFVAPTLWGTVSFIADEVMRVSAQVKSSVEAFGPFKTLTTTTLADLKISSETTVKILAVIMKTMKKLATENDAVKAAMLDLETKLRSGNLTSATEDKSMEALMHRLEMNGRSPSSPGTPASRESLSTPPSRVDDAGRSAADENLRRLMQVIEDVGRLKEASDIADENFRRVHQVIEEVNVLKDFSNLASENFTKFNQVIEDVSVLKVASETAVVKFGNLGIRNLQESTHWVEQNFPATRYGVMIDPLILLERIYGNDDIDSITQLKTWESRQKLGIETGSEETSLTALNNRRPRIFHCGRPTMSCDQNTSRLNKLKKHSVWKTGGQGVRNDIFERMNVLRPNMAADIEDAFAEGAEGVTPKAKVIATMCLAASVTFLTQLCNYVDALFEKLHVYSKFTPETGWSLTMQVLDRILADLFAPKEGVGNAIRGSNRAAYVVLACLRTHDVAQIYIDHNFENHPAVSSEFIKFLATNSGFEKVEKLTLDMEKEKSKLASALLEVAKASSKADTASAKSTEAERAVLALKNRVVTLEGSNRAERGGGRGNS